MAEKEPALSISVMSGGTLGTGKWKAAVIAMAKRVRDARGAYDAHPSLQVIFQIPGEVLKPDFAELRTGTFSRKQARLAIQVAIPEADLEDKEAFLLARLTDALDEAEKFLAAEAFPGIDLSGLRRLVVNLGNGADSSG